jgi:hypothetical protein
MTKQEWAEWLITNRQGIARYLERCGCDDCERQLQPVLMLDKFDEAYERLAEDGQCDTPGGGEYRRVIVEWIVSGFPEIDEFIVCRANACPLIVNDRVELAGRDPWRLIQVA